MVIREYSRSMVACKRWPVIIIMCVAGKHWIGIRDRLPRVGEIRDREGTRLDELGEKLGTELVENSLVPYKKYCM